MTDNFDIPAKSLEKISGASKVTVLTGAGVSAESGVPTFRGKDGLWMNHRAEELATPEAFGRDPALVWKWYDWRRRTLAPLKPNPGHYALVDMEKFYDRFTLITQNVDGLHRMAGARNVLELHGNIWRAKCLKEGTVMENRQSPLPEIPPLCPDCGAMTRPDIVWFGESLDPEILQKALASAQEAEVFLILGTSGVVQPACSLAGVAKSAGATVVEINIEPTPITQSADVFLQGATGHILPRLVNIIKSA